MKIWPFAAIALLLAGAALANPLVPGATPEALPSLPGPLNDAVLWINRQQRALHQMLSRNVGEVQQSGSLVALAALLGLSFAYGVLHAAGPGHGKAVISAYFVSRGLSFLRGALAAAFVALVQAFSAIAIVAALAALLGMRQFDVLRQASVLEIASYGLIVALGLAMLVNTLRGRDACGHDHAHGEGHGRGQPGAGGMIGLALATGIRPCTGALIVLLYALGGGIFLVGIAATLAMGLGVAATLIVIGWASLGARRGLLRLAETRPGWSSGARTALGVAGSLAVTALGGLLLLASLNA